MNTLKTKHIIATGTGNIGIAARIAELLTISVGSILLSFVSMLMKIFLFDERASMHMQTFENSLSPKNGLVLKLALKLS